MKLRALGVAVGGLVLLGAGALQATPITGSRVNVDLGNDGFGVTDASDLDPASASLNYSRAFTGLDSSGGTETMNLSATGAASSAGGALKASLSATLSDPVYTSNNSPYVDSSFNVDPDGIPSLFFIQSFASFSDDLTIVSPGSPDTIQITLGLSGTMTGDPARGGPFVWVYQDIAGQFSPGGNLLFVDGNEGPLDTTVLSDPITVTGGLASFSYSLHVQTAFFIEDFAEGGTFTHTNDFSNTLEILGVTGFDSTGQEISISSVTTSDGTELLATDGSSTKVPAPATVALFGVGLVGLGAIARRRRKAA